MQTTAPTSALATMKTFGILGGMSNQASAAYYRLINRLVRPRSIAGPS
jgi:hypothetical protein